MFARGVAAVIVAVLGIGIHVFTAGGSAGGTSTAQSPQVPGARIDSPRSPRIASYSIDARLDPARRMITGAETITWRNASANPARSLQFHLYYNAWRNPDSTWLRERQLVAGPADVSPGDWGSIDLTSVRVARQDAGTADLSDRVRFIAPDDGNTSDRTVAEVPLDSPVGPGEAMEIHITWSSRVPRTFSRTGVVGNYYFVAQWFPKIGVLEDTGWNCHQFHYATEFFSDFGNYDVRLTVPRGWIVGATGTEQERREGPDGTITHRYFQQDVHDFAWTTSPDYLELADTFTHPALPDVRLRLLLQPEHRGQAGRHFAAARAALKHYGEWFGPYPYGHLTIVDPAWQSGAGGMEYPTLITAGTRWLAPRDVVQPESVTVHEAGHQFWYGVVANNEFEHAWLDEGLNTFATARVIEQGFEPNYAAARYFGGFIPWVFRDLPVSRARETRAAAHFRRTAAADRPSLPTWRHWPGTAAGVTYSKTALWLHTLERMLGWPVVQRILSTFYTRWAFRHPRPEDFTAVVTEVSGQDLTAFLEGVLQGSDTFDYGVERFVSEPVTGRALTNGSSSVARGTAEGRAGTYRTTVVARRYGEGVFPVDVRVLLQDGAEIRWRWDGRERWKRFETETAVPARRADVDPDGILLLDVHRTNNSALRTAAAGRASLKWSLVWLVWLQDHLLTYGVFI